MLKSDAPDLVMVNLGIDPKTSEQPEWDEAAAWLTKLRDSDTFYAAYDQGYVDDLTAGNLAGTMAWSGDVLYYKIWEGQPFEFIVPDGRRAAVDRQHADPGQLGEPRWRARDDGLLLQARDRADGDGMGAVHVAGARRCRT